MEINIFVMKSKLLVIKLIADFFSRNEVVKCAKIPKVSLLPWKDKNCQKDYEELEQPKPTAAIEDLLWRPNPQPDVLPWENWGL